MLLKENEGQEEQDRDEWMMKGRRGKKAKNRQDWESALREAVELMKKEEYAAHAHVLCLVMKCAELGVGPCFLMSTWQLYPCSYMWVDF